MSKFIFIGGTNRGYELLKALLKKKYIPKSAVILKEDEHERLKYSEKISGMLIKNKIPFTIKKKLEKKDYDKIRKIVPDFILVYGWRTLIDIKISRHVKYGIIAAHQSLLPEYRGFAPVQWVIINGEKETGVTLFQISKGEPDSGKIFFQKKIPIGSDEYAAEIDKKIIKASIELFLTLFESVKKGQITFTRQDETKATYACRRVPDDGKINWGDTSKNIYNLIRALAHPYTGAFCKYNENTYLIRRAKLGDSNQKRIAGKIPGRVFKIRQDGIEVLCGEGTIFISEWENKSDGIVSCPSKEVKSITATMQ